VSFSVHLRTQLVAIGQVISALPKSIADQHSLKVLPIELTAQPWSVAIFTLKNRTLSPSYIAHDLMETDAARTGKDQGRATRDTGPGRPQYPARNRDQAFAHVAEGDLLQALGHSP
jgi:hypothetical protein